MSENTEEKEPEVHSMPKANGAPGYQKTLAVIISILALVYNFSPIDLSLDALPIVGWMDDVGISLAAVLNLLEKYQSQQNGFLVKFLRLSKWLLIILIVIATLIAGGLIVGIIALVKFIIG